MGVQHVGYRQLEGGKKTLIEKGNDMDHGVIIMKNGRMRELHMEDNTVLIPQ